MIRSGEAHHWSAPSDRSATALVARRVGSAFLIEDRLDATSEELAASLPAVPVSLVVATTISGEDDVLRAVARFVSDVGVPVVRIVRMFAGTSITATWWQDLADRSGVELIVSSGRVELVGETMYTRGDGPGDVGSWLRCRPHRAIEDIGPRHPVPLWHAAVLDRPESVGGVVARPVAAGVLLGDPDLAPVHLAGAVAADLERLTVVVEARCGIPVSAHDVAAFLARLPVAVRSEVRLVRIDGADVVAWGEAVACALGEDVTTVLGVPLASGAEERVVLLDPSGCRTWEPYLQEVRCHAVGSKGATGHRWRSPVPHLPALGPGIAQVGEDWMLVTMSSGMWLRPARRFTEWTPTGAVSDPTIVVVAVGEPGLSLPDGVWLEVSAILDHLEPAVLRRVVVSVLGTVTEAGLAAVTEITARRDIGLRVGRAARRTRPGTRAL